MTRETGPKAGPQVPLQSLTGLNGTTPVPITDDLRAYLTSLPSSTFTHLASLAREREARATVGAVGTWMTEAQRLTRRAQVTRVVMAMVLEDHYPSSVVVDVCTTLWPDVEGLIRQTVDELLRAAA